MGKVIYILHLCCTGMNEVIYATFLTGLEIHMHTYKAKPHQASGISKVQPFSGLYHAWLTFSPLFQQLLWN